MNASAIVMMLVALVVIWGGFVLAILRLPQHGQRKQQGERQCFFHGVFRKAIVNGGGF